MTKFRLTIVVACLAALIGLAGVNWYASLRSPHTVTSQTDPNVRIGGPFTLTDTAGRTVTEASLRGKWSLVFFGFTYCPDVCPLTLQNLGRTQKLLGGKAKDVQIVFITVDPERDTPKDLKAYLSSGGFPTGVVGLSGTTAQIGDVAKAYRVTIKKVPTPEAGSGSYTVQHTSVVYLMDPKGNFSVPLTADMTPQQNADQIKQAMSSPY